MMYLKIAACATCIGVSQAQVCPSMMTRFVENTSLLNGSVLDAVVWDDGTGPAIYAVGTFLPPGMPSRGVARWRPGEGWTAVGEGVSFTALAIEVFDDGTGEKLYVGGNFISLGDSTVNFITRWNGTDFEPVGDGFNSQVTALAVYDDGNGEALYAGGEFTMSGATEAQHVARWTGTQWVGVGQGLSRTTNTSLFYVRDMHVFDDGTGEALYVGGGFDVAGVVTTPNIAKWTATDFWQRVGNGSSSGNPTHSVFSLATFDAGNGPRLYVAGTSPQYGGVNTGFLGAWDGATWSRPIDGINGPVYEVDALDDGEGAQLYFSGTFNSAAGTPTTGTARWNGTSVENETTGGVTRAFAALPTGDDAVLFMGRNFPAPYALARFDGDWAPTDIPLTGPKLAALWVRAPHLGGPAMYLAGSPMTDASGGASSVMRQTENGWRAVGALAEQVRDMEDDRRFATPRVVALTANSVWSWDSVAWTEINPGTGTSETWDSMHVVQSGPAAGIYISSPSRIMRYHQDAWTDITPSATYVRFLTSANFDPRPGDELYASGRFPVPPNNVAPVSRFDGFEWTPILGHPNTSADGIATGDLGEGVRILTAGNRGVQSWDGSTWTQVFPASYTQTTYQVVVGESATGPLVIASSGVNVSSWDGTRVCDLATASAFIDRLAFVPRTDRDPVAFALGNFQEINGQPADGLAVVAFPPRVCPADMTGSSDPSDPAYGQPDGLLNADDFFYFIDQYAAGNLSIADVSGSTDPSDPAYGVPDGVIDPADFFYYLDTFVAGCE